MKTIELSDFRDLQALGREDSDNLTFSAYQISLGKRVFLKVLRNGKGRIIISRFKTESDILKLISHPRVPKWLEAGSENGFTYFSMEFVEGESLGAQIARMHGEIFSEKRALVTIEECAGILRDLWNQHKAMHLDIKPAHFICCQGKWFLIDFGCAEIFGAKYDWKEVGFCHGTPYYISPEQITQECPCDFCADMYSLGVILYEMITGVHLFGIENSNLLLNCHADALVRPPNIHNSSLSPGVVLLVGKMLQKKAGDRYASYDDLISEIQNILAGRPLQYTSKRDVEKIYTSNPRTVFIY